MQSKDFRQNAAECERLARESPDAYVKLYLDELAVEFRKQAVAIETLEPIRPVGIKPQLAASITQDPVAYDGYGPGVLPKAGARTIRRCRQGLRD